MFHVVVGVCTGAAALAKGYPPYSYFIWLIHIDISSVVTEQLVRTRVISVRIDSQGRLELKEVRPSCRQFHFCSRPRKYGALYAEARMMVNGRNWAADLESVPSCL